MFDAEAYRRLLTQFCEQIAVGMPVCDDLGGLSMERNPIVLDEEPVTPATITEPRIGPDPRLTFEESAADMLARADVERRRHLEVIFSRIDRGSVETMRRKYATDINERFVQDPASEIKYLDLPYWIAHKLGLALRLGLHDRTPIDILDLGTGASHFLAVCQGFGHRCIGTDVEVPLYADIAQCLGVTRLIERIEPRTILNDHDRRFDLVSAIWISFNSLGTKDGRRIYWTLEDWRFLIEDLKARHLKRPATIHFELNLERDYDLGKDVFNKALMDMFKGWGASVDETAGRLTLAV